MTHQPTGNVVHATDEDGIGTAVEGQGAHGVVVGDGADEVLVVHQEEGEGEAQKEGRDAAADEALPGLLRGHLDQRRLAEHHAEDVGENVVGDDHRGGN